MYKRQVDSSKSNLEASAPSFIDHVTFSLEENVRTALLFSSIVAVAAVSPSALPVGPVINGDVSSIITVTN